MKYITYLRIIVILGLLVPLGAHPVYGQEKYSKSEHTLFTDLLRMAAPADDHESDEAYKRILFNLPYIKADLRQLLLTWDDQDIRYWAANFLATYRDEDLIDDFILATNDRIHEVASRSLVALSDIAKTKVSDSSKKKLLNLGTRIVHVGPVTLEHYAVMLLTSLHDERCVSSLKFVLERRGFSSANGMVAGRALAKLGNSDAKKALRIELDRLRAAEKELTTLCGEK